MHCACFQPVVRPKKVFKPIKIPKRLQSQLPFKDKPKTSKIGPRGNMKKQRIAVVRDQHEYKVKRSLKTLGFVYFEAGD